MMLELNNEDAENLAGQVRRLRIIVRAMVSGAAIFMLIGLFVDVSAAEEGQQPIITYLAVGYTPLALIGFAVVPPLIVSRGLKKIAKGTYPTVANQLRSRADPEFLASDAGRLLGLYSTKTIIGCAMIEGSALIAIVAYIVEGQLWTLLATSGLIMMLFCQIPTLTGVRYWIEDQLRIIEEMKPLA